MVNQDLIQLFAEAMEIDAPLIQPERRLDEYVEWNSLVWLTVMSLLDERYGIHLTGREIRGFVTVQDVIDNISSKAPGK